MPVRRAREATTSAAWGRSPAADMPRRACARSARCGLPGPSGQWWLSEFRKKSARDRDNARQASEPGGSRARSSEQSARESTAARVNARVREPPGRSRARVLAFCAVLVGVLPEGRWRGSRWGAGAEPEGRWRGAAGALARSRWGAGAEPLGRWRGAAAGALARSGRWRGGPLARRAAGAEGRWRGGPAGAGWRWREPIRIGNATGGRLSEIARVRARKLA
jgi:hypothetical protein